MGLTVATRSFTGKGKFYIRPRAGGARRFLGNVSEASFSIEQDTVQEPDYTSGGGGVLNERTRVSAVTGEMTTYNHSPDNLAILMRGTLTDVARAAITTEAHALCYADGFEPFDNIPDPDVTVTLSRTTSAAWAGTTAYVLGALVLDTGRIYAVTTAGTSGSTEPTWPTDGTTVTDGTVVWQDTGTVALVKDTDYSLSGAGFTPLASGKLQWSVLGEPINAAYTAHEATEIHALTDSGTEYNIFFEGLNEADSGNPVTLEVLRSTFSPTDGLGLISDEFATATLKFSCLRDTTVTSSTESAFLKIKMVNTAA